MKLIMKRVIEDTLTLILCYLLSFQLLHVGQLVLRSSVRQLLNVIQHFY